MYIRMCFGEGATSTSANMRMLGLLCYIMHCVMLPWQGVHNSLIGTCVELRQANPHTPNPCAGVPMSQGMGECTLHTLKTIPEFQRQRRRGGGGVRNLQRPIMEVFEVAIQPQATIQTYESRPKAHLYNLGATIHTYISQFVR